MLRKLARIIPGEDDANDTVCGNCAWHDEKGSFTVRSFNPVIDSIHSSAEEAERWCMEQI